MAEPTSIDVAAAPVPTYAPDADVNVVSPRGRAGTVKGHSVEAALAAGYQLEDAGATHERVLQKKYGDAPIKAGLLGAARGATFGLSDVVLRGLGAREATAALERYNPISSTIGEVGGAIGGALIPGLGAVGELGHGVDEAVAGSKAIAAFAKGGKVARAVARYAPVLARGAVEGAAYGAGGGVSHAALSDDPMTAEAVLGDMASGALLGAGTGAAMAAGGRFLADSATWAKARWSSAGTPTIADGILEHSTMAPAAAEHVPVEPTGEVPRARVEPPAETPRPSEPVPDHVVEDFKMKYNLMTRASRQQFRTFEDLVERGRPIPPELEQAIQDSEAKRLVTHSMLPLEGNKTGMRSYESSDPMLGGSGERGGSYARGQDKISMQWTAPNAEIADVVRTPAFREALAEHQAAIDHAQSLLPNHRAYPPIIEAEHPLLSPAARGGGAGGSSSGLSPNATSLLDDLNAKAAAPATKVHGNAKLSPEATKALFGVEPSTAAEGAAAKKAASAAHTPAAKGHGEGTLTDAFQAQLRPRLAHHVSTGVVHSIEHFGLNALGIGGGYSVGRLAHHWVKEHTGSDALGYIAGAVAGVPLAIFMGHTIRAPLAALLRGRATGGMAKMAEAVDGVLSGRGPAIARRTAAGVLGGVSFAVGRAREKPAGTAFQQRAAELSNVVANPVKARTAVHAQLAGVRAADPMLSDQMEELAMARLFFLHAKMPKDPGAGALLGRRAPWSPTDAQVSKWARYVDAAEHPEHVLHAVGDGTITAEQVETLETLYPTTYERVRADIVDRAAELQAELPWSRRLALSTLFHVPVDDVLRPQNVAAMQATFVKEPPKGAPSSPSLGSIKPPQPTRAQSLASH